MGVRCARFVSAAFGRFVLINIAYLDTVVLKQLWQAVARRFFEMQHAKGLALNRSSPALTLCTARKPFPLPGQAKRSILSAISCANIQNFHA